jgi:hypothetical protein
MIGALGSVADLPDQGVDYGKWHITLVVRCGAPDAGSAGTIVNPRSRVG